MIHDAIAGPIAVKVKRERNHAMTDVISTNNLIQKQNANNQGIKNTFHACVYGKRRESEAEVTG